MGMGQDGWPWLALAYFRLGDARTAGKWLERSARNSTSKRSQLRTSGVAYTPGRELVFLIGLREAKEVIEGKPLDEDPDWSLLEYCGKAAQGGPPKLADYDQAIAISPYDVAYWLARGRRLAELEAIRRGRSRFQQGGRVKPDDPQVRAAGPLSRPARRFGSIRRTRYSSFSEHPFTSIAVNSTRQRPISSRLPDQPSLCTETRSKVPKSYREKKAAGAGPSGIPQSYVARSAIHGGILRSLGFCRKTKSG